MEENKVNEQEYKDFVKVVKAINLWETFVNITGKEVEHGSRKTEERSI